MLRHLLAAHGERVWGRFGFTDAFNETRDWWADTFLAIDQGPILVMMENYRTGLLWKLFMAAPEVRRGLARLGFEGIGRVSDLERWIARQWDHAAAMMLRSISPVSIVKERPRFGQVIRPKPGAVVASPVLAAYDPDPDYFFHWYRDAALVMDALRLLRGDVPQADGLFQDYVRFNLDLAALDGRDVTPGWEDRATPDFRQFLRKNIALAYGEAIPAETRVNPDGTLDITDWPRPQHDGPALEALTLMRWGADGAAAELLAQKSRFRLAARPQTLLRYLGRRVRAACLYLARLGGSAGRGRGMAGASRRFGRSGALPRRSRRP